MLAPVIHIDTLREGNMPRATVNTQETETYELKTLPRNEATGEEAGFVELRRMNYNEFLRRRDMVSKMSFQGEGKNQQAVMEMAQEVVTKYEFTTCIVNHNLEDDNGKPIDFRTKQAFNYLDPRVGEEISEYIDKMNKWTPDDDDEGNDPLPDSED